MVDYPTQVKNKPITSGAVLPSSCTIVGNQFFLTTTKTLYVCNGTTYQEIQGTFINVRQFGAKGDGVADDTAAINAAIAAAAAAGGTVFMPCGTYLLTGAGLNIAKNTVMWFLWFLFSAGRFANTFSMR
jgi:hypothetical protein